MKTKKILLKKAKALSEKELNKVFGGYGGTDLCTPGIDDLDCTSELSSGGGTTDTE